MTFLKIKFGLALAAAMTLVAAMSAMGYTGQERRNMPK
jgi:hypothetical protein